MDAFDVGGLGHIAGDRNDAAARIAAGRGRCTIRNGFGRGLQRFRAAGCDHDVGTGRHELGSDCKAKPLAAAGHNRRTAVKRDFHGGFL